MSSYTQINNSIYTLPKDSEYYDIIYRIAKSIADDNNITDVDSIALKIDPEEACFRYSIAGIMDMAGSLPIVGDMIGKSKDTNKTDGGVMSSVMGGLKSLTDSGLDFATNNPAITAGLVTFLFKGGDVMSALEAMLVAKVTNSAGAGIGAGVADGFLNSILGAAGGAGIQSLATGLLHSSSELEKLVRYAEDAQQNPEQQKMLDDASAFAKQMATQIPDPQNPSRMLTMEEVEKSPEAMQQLTDAISQKFPIDQLQEAAAQGPLGDKVEEVNQALTQVDPEKAMEALKANPKFQEFIKNEENNKAKDNQPEDPNKQEDNKDPNKEEQTSNTQTVGNTPPDNTGTQPTKNAPAGNVIPTPTQVAASTDYTNPFRAMTRLK